MAAVDRMASLSFLILVHQRLRCCITQRHYVLCVFDFAETCILDCTTFVRVDFNSAPPLLFCIMAVQLCLMMVVLMITMTISHNRHNNNKVYGAIIFVKAVARVHSDHLNECGQGLDYKES